MRLQSIVPTLPDDAPAPSQVCFVLPSLNGGGAERAAVQMLNGLDAGGVGSLDVPVRARGTVSRRSRSGDRDLHVGATPPSRGGRWRALRSFHRATSRPDIVMAFLSYFTVLSAARAAQTGARVVFNQQTPMSAFLTDADYQWRPALAPDGVHGDVAAGLRRRRSDHRDLARRGRRPDQQLRRQPGSDPGGRRTRSISIARADARERTDGRRLPTGGTTP